MMGMLCDALLLQGYQNVTPPGDLGKFGARAARQRHKLLRNRLDERHARNGQHFRRLPKGCRPKRSPAPFDGWQT